jgi:hypothetical protein
MVFGEPPSSLDRQSRHFPTPALSVDSAAHGVLITAHLDLHPQVRITFYTCGPYG